MMHAPIAKSEFSAPDVTCPGDVVDAANHHEEIPSQVKK